MPFAVDFFFCLGIEIDIMMSFLVDLTFAFSGVELSVCAKRVRLADPLMS